LSGNPGCGKTLTAEAVSEVTKRPLYPVSAGELGTEPEKVDQQLTSILEISHKWSAILLLDEADVFLQERDAKDVARNALVSIFLRQLEYYQGILILTTNRIANCDPAFESTMTTYQITPSYWLTAVHVQVVSISQSTTPISMPRHEG
jgi:SpoVK/Ycf46/Vps4 family AAA+-type ATPase